MYTRIPQRDRSIDHRGETGDLEVLVSRARNQVFFRTGGSEVNSRLIDGTYPNYTQVIPKKSSTTIEVSTSELTQIVRAVSLFARDSANVIKIKGGEDTLTLSATTNEVGDSRGELPAKIALFDPRGGTAPLLKMLNRPNLGPTAA